MTTAQTSKVICNSIQIINKRRDLRPRIIRPSRIPIQRRRAKPRIEAWHVTRQIESLEREINECFDLVGKWAFEGEPFKVDEENWGEAGEGELFCRSAEGFAVGAIPVPSKVRLRAVRVTGVRTMRLSSPSPLC